MQCGSHDQRLEEAPSPFSWQSEALRQMGSGRDILVLQPTGSGKSVCVEAPVALWKQRVLVLSPLRSLMGDQCRRWQSKGLQVWNPADDSLSGGSSPWQRILGADWQILLLSPERLNQWIELGLAQRLFRGMNGIDWVVLDEFHLFRDWSTFRKDYLDAKGFLAQERLTNSFRFAALSATMPLKEARLWFGELTHSYFESLGPLGRKNIYVKVVPLWQPAERWLAAAELLKDKDIATLLFARSRSVCEQLTLFLKAMGFSVEAYHAGKSPYQRKILEEALRNERIDSLVCTKAFGLGVDLPHIKRVIHFELPYSLAAYWQEVGRAGRAGEPSEAYVLWSPSDTGYRLVEEPHGPNAPADVETHALANYLRSNQCRRQILSDHFGLPGEERCGACDNCRDQRGYHKSLLPREFSFRFGGGKPWWLDILHRKENSV
jgi:ATP-dependent DNA helicase RecQ